MKTIRMTDEMYIQMMKRLADCMDKDTDGYDRINLVIQVYSTIEALVTSEVFPGEVDRAMRFDKIQKICEQI